MHKHLYIRKILFAAITVAMIGCSSAKKTEKDSDAENSAAPVSAEMPDGADKAKLLQEQRDLITDYDKSAVPGLAIEKLKTDRGISVPADRITLSKQNGIITAKGYYYENGDKHNFSISYEFNGTDYREMSADLDYENAFSKEENTVKDILLNAAPDRTYDVTLANGISVSASHSGEGTLIIRMVGSEGGVTEIFNDSGTFDETRKKDLPAGKYELQMINTSGGWSFRYSTY